jgi:hypothetical protein
LKAKTGASINYTNSIKLIPNLEGNNLIGLVLSQAKNNAVIKTPVQLHYYNNVPLCSSRAKQKHTQKEIKPWPISLQLEKNNTKT